MGMPRPGRRWAAPGPPEVPEGKSCKNRVRLDLHVERDRSPEEVRRLEGLGATGRSGHDDRGGPCWTVLDPEETGYVEERLHPSRNRGFCGILPPGTPLLGGQVDETEAR